VTVWCAAVDRIAALELLPEVYARALRLRDEGASTARIASELGIALEAVASTLELAEAKLTRLAQRDGGGAPESPEPRRPPP
jgi:DNA-directed RNA polymerase specialized sigma24 family protein